MKSIDMNVKKPESLAAEKFTNIEIVLLAVLLIGGGERVVDMEDLAVKANELAPGRFAWRKYPQQINIENVRTVLSDAKKVKNGNLVNGSGRTGWSLTVAGLARARQVEDRFFRLASAATLPVRKRVNPIERQRQARERERLLTSDVFLKLQTSSIDRVTRHEAETFFRLDDYVADAMRERKITRVLNAIGADNIELLRAANSLAAKVRDAELQPSSPTKSKPSPRVRHKSKTKKI